MQLFSSFNISFVPREQNKKEDSLALVASLFNPDDLQNKNTFQVKRIFRPSMLDNEEYLQLFEKDEELNDFLANEDDLEESNSNVACVPKNCIKSESFFTRDDQAKILKEEESVRKVQGTQKINIGTYSSFRYVNLGIDCTPEKIVQYGTLFKEYFDVFSWTYDDLKEYEKSTFRHVIPLKEGVNPFKQKLKNINPKLKPLVNIELISRRKLESFFPSSSQNGFPIQ